MAMYDHKNDVSKQRDDELSRLLGPTEDKVKKQASKKLRKKLKNKMKQENEELQERLDKQGNSLFDFMEDFSSSDYDSLSESEIQNFPDVGASITNRV